MKKKVTICFGFDGQNFDRFLKITNELLIENINCKPGDTLKLELEIEQERSKHGNK